MWVLQTLKYDFRKDQMDQTYLVYRFVVNSLKKKPLNRTCVSFCVYYKTEFFMNLEHYLAISNSIENSVPPVVKLVSQLIDCKI